MSLRELIDALPAQARRHVEPESPLPMRMMASKGMAPLPPVEMVIVVAALSFDADEKISTSAIGTLGKLPDQILAAALAVNLPPVALAVLAPTLLDRADMLELLVLNRGTLDATIAQLAPDVPASVAEIIASNQERCLRSEAIVRNIAQNEAILRSSLDRLFDFLVRSGVIHDDMPEFADALLRLSPTEAQEAAEKIQLPPDVYGMLEEGGGEIDDEQAAEIVKTLEAPGDSNDREKRIPMLKLIAGCTVSQRVALALRGNKEARTLLVRDTNKVVSTAAIKSPRVTEGEVVAVAKSRSISDEVIRIICQSKDMTRSYGVKVALVNNPKTPLPTAMKFLPLMRQNELRALAKSKNITSALANQAKRMMAAKAGGK